MVAFKAVKTKVNGTEEIIGYKLINALTGKAFTAKDATGKEYDTFYKDASETLAFVDANGSTCGFLYANGGRLSVVTSRPTSGRVTYNLKAVDPEALKAEEINKVNDDYFGLQFGYINNDGDYVNYESVNGSDPFAGKLVAKTESFGTNNQGTASTKIELKTSTDYPETYFIYNETADAYVVLLKDKWSKYNTNLTPASEVGKGHKFALMTAKEIIEDQLKDSKDQIISAWSFSVNMPVVVDFSPLEVVAVSAVTPSGNTTVVKDLEMLISNMDGQDYLTTTLAVEGTDNKKQEAVRPSAYRGKAPHKTRISR